MSTEAAGSGSYPLTLGLRRGWGWACCANWGNQQILMTSQRGSLVPTLWNQTPGYLRPGLVGQLRPLVPLSLSFPICPVGLMLP